MKITKDGKYVTRRDKYPVEILATDMDKAYPVLARYLHPEGGWKILSFDESGRCSFAPVMDLIEAPNDENELRLTIEEFNVLRGRIQVLEIKVRTMGELFERGKL